MLKDEVLCRTLLFFPDIFMSFPCGIVCLIHFQSCSYTTNQRAGRVFVNSVLVVNQASWCGNRVCVCVFIIAAN